MNSVLVPSWYLNVGFEKFRGGEYPLCRPDDVWGDASYHAIMYIEDAAMDVDGDEWVIGGVFPRSYFVKHNKSNCKYLIRT